MRWSRPNCAAQWRAFLPNCGGRGERQQRMGRKEGERAWGERVPDLYMRAVEGELATCGGRGVERVVPKCVGQRRAGLPNCGWGGERWWRVEYWRQMMQHVAGERRAGLRCIGAAVAAGKGGKVPERQPAGGAGAGGSHLVELVHVALAPVEHRVALTAFPRSSETHKGRHERARGGRVSACRVRREVKEWLRVIGQSSATGARESPPVPPLGNIHPAIHRRCWALRLSCAMVLCPAAYSRPLVMRVPLSCR
jgi:hypothetical protein